MTHKALEDATRKATPGPFVVSNKVCRLNGTDYLVVLALDKWFSLVMDDGEQSEADAAYIALANPTAILSVLAELSTLEARLAAVIEGVRCRSVDGTFTAEAIGWNGAINEILERMKALSTPEAKPEAQS